MKNYLLIAILGLFMLTVASKVYIEYPSPEIVNIVDDVGDYETFDFVFTSIDSKLPNVPETYSIPTGALLSKPGWQTMKAHLIYNERMKRANVKIVKI